MAQLLNLDIKGLWTDTNELNDSVAQGALSVASNIVVDKPNIAESRRGFKAYAALTSPDSVFTYLNKLVVHYDTNKLAYDSDGAGTFSQISGTFAHPESGYKTRAVKANQNLYLNTSTGVRKLDSFSGSFVNSGVPKALDGTAALATGTSGFLTSVYTVAYRIVWGYKDANQNLILGSPSARIEIYNTDTVNPNRDVDLTFAVPSSITTSHFYQIYRTAQIAGQNSPNDELQLVYEANPSSGQITAKSITITDTTPDSLKGAALYTNPSQEGILQSNEQPPFCKDMAWFKDSVFFANTKTKQRLYITLVSVGGTAGIQVDDTLTLAGVTYTAKAAEANNQFAVTTGGLISQNIDATARSLVNTINSSSTNTSVYAYYLTGSDDLPGKILVEERTIGGAAFTAVCSRGTAFSPNLASAESSDNEAKVNRIYFSKPLQPESVPLLNYLDVGSANEPIKRIVALRDSLFILKTEGVYRLIGEDRTSFRVTLFDNTAKLISPESAVPFNNQVYCFTDQGIVAISDSGVAVLSRPIESSLFRIANYSAFSSSFAVSYESDRKYILFTPSLSTDTACSIAWVYNSFTNSWTTWDLAKTCGLVNPTDNKLYLGGSTSLYQERKSFTLDDFADDELAVTVSSSSGYSVVLASVSGIDAGDTLAQGSILRAVITSVDSGTNTLTVDKELSWTAASATVYTPILCKIEWVKQACGNAGVLKHVHDCVLMFEDASFNEIDVSFATNFSEYPTTVTVSPKNRAAWGTFPWGQVAWGGALGGEQTIRTYVPLEKQRANWVKTNVQSSQAFTSFSLLGMSLQFTAMSERFK